MNEQLNFNPNVFTDEDGNRFDLDSDVYNPKTRDISSLIIGGLKAAVQARGEVTES